MEGEREWLVKCFNEMSGGVKVHITKKKTMNRPRESEREAEREKVPLVATLR